MTEQKAKSDSLRELLDKFNEDPDSFDPEKVIGELEGKVDALKWRMDSWEAEAAMIQKEWIAQFEKRKASLLNASKRLNEYIKNQLISRELTGLQGKMLRLALQKNSNPTVIEPHAAGPADFLAFPKYVRQDITYSWNKDIIAEDTEQKSCPIPNVTVKHGQHIRFWPKKGEK